MTRHPRSIFAALTVCVLASPLPAQWQAVGDGIEYREYTIAGPNRLFVARLIRSNTNAFIESSIAQGKVSGGFETVPSQAARYEDAIGYWGQTWGTRNDVVVAVNGSFYNTSTGQAQGGIIHSGWYDKQYDNFGGYSGFVWQLDRDAYIGLCVTHEAAKQFVTYLTPGATQTLQGINRARGSGELVIYTSDYDSNTKTDNSGSEVLVEMQRPSMILPSPNYARGTIRQIRQNLGSTNIPFDHVVLSATGSAATTLLSRAVVGQDIGITHEIKSLDDECNTGFSLDWTKSYAAINGNWEFLQGGVIYDKDPDHLRHPRTAIAYDAGYVYYVVCDGRSTASIGMTILELADFCKNTLGATWGINMDGGGSSTMVINGVVKNVPSDGTPRAVSNGMMMCNFLPKVQSTVFAGGNAVRTTASVNVRLGPGTNYSSIATLGAGVNGTVLSHGMMGVLAKSYYWWKCDFSGTVGWVAEPYIQIPGATPPTVTQHPAAQFVCPGATATFTVAATGDAPLSYQWQKSQADLANGGHYSGATTATLTVSSCDAGDLANYRCVVTNTAGSASSNEAALTLKNPTTVTADPVSKVVYPGGTVQFTCAGAGTGTVQYRWQKNGGTMRDAGHYAGTQTATLTVSSADGADAAAYRCVVTANCGFVYSSPATLTVTVIEDLDLDGDVDGVDMGIFASCFNGTGNLVSGTCLGADFNGDSYVDGGDYGLFAGCFNGTGNRPACAS